MWASKSALTLSKVLDAPARWSVALGAAALAIITAVVVIDSGLRFTLSRALQGSVDIVGLVLVIVFFAAYAFSELKKEHIQVDALVQRLPPTVQQIVTTNGSFLTIVIMILISWQFVVQAFYLKEGGFFSGVLHIPPWPFVLVGAFFFALFVLALLVTFFNRLAELLSAEGAKAYLWLLPGIVVALGLFAFSLQPSLLPFEITRGVWGGIVVLLLFVLIFLKVPIAAAMAVASLFGLSYLSGVEASLTNLSMSAVRVGCTYTWSVAPLFLWMGLLAYYSGFAKELYDTSYKWIGHAPGGLASATVGACTGLSAITGSSMTGVLAMGVIALPQMRAHKYDVKLATATICAASTIGMLIPPSLGFIVYGMITEVSIGKLFIAGIFPGIMFSVILIAMITVMCRMNPKLGPPGPVTPWKERLVSLKDIWAVVFLVVFVIGGLYLGLFTPTEAGAMGCFGALIIGVVRRRLSIKNLAASMTEAVRLNGVIMFIFVMATAFGYFLAATNLPYDLADWIVGLGLPPYAVIALILFIYMILGCVMNSLPAVILTLPIFFPIAMAAGFDPIWFGVLIVVMVDLGQITPPIGMNVFAMSAIAKDIPMYTIFRGVLPFWGAFIVLIIILVMFPQISLFLPSMMK